MKQLAHKFGLATATATSLLWTTAARAQTLPDISPVDNVDIIDIIQNVIDFLLLIAGALAVAYLIYAGIMYIVGGAKGDADAKKAIINALTGVVIIVLSYVLVNVVMGLVRGEAI